MRPSTLLRMNTQDTKRIIETALLCAGEPLTLKTLAHMFDDAVGPDTLRHLLADLQDEWGAKRH